MEHFNTRAEIEMCASRIDWKKRGSKTMAVRKERQRNENRAKDRKIKGSNDREDENGVREDANCSEKWIWNKWKKNNNQKEEGIRNTPWTTENERGKLSEYTIVFLLFDFSFNFPWCVLYVQLRCKTVCIDNSLTTLTPFLIKLWNMERDLNGFSFPL